MLVGAERGFPPSSKWITRAVDEVPERRKAELDSFEALGIPPRLGPYCHYWPGRSPFSDELVIAEGAVVVLAVGGQHGLPRTIDEILEIRALGLGFDLTLQDGFDLVALRGLLDLAPRIVIRGRDLVGWAVLREAVVMRSLFTSSQLPAPLRLDDLTELRKLTTIDQNALFIGSNPHIEELDVTINRWPRDAVLGSSVAKLDIWEGRHVSQLPAMQRPGSLEQLTIRTTRSFDMASLRGSGNLRSLTLGQCEEVLNCEALLHLPSLGELIMGDVARMPGWEVLHQLRLDKFELGSPSFASPAHVRGLVAAVRSSAP